MRDDNQIHPFLSATPSPGTRNGKLQPSLPLTSGSHAPRSSKCLVYALFLFVVLCVFALVFGAFVMHLKSPAISLPSIAARNVRWYGGGRPSSSDSAASWEAAVAARVAIRNGNLYGPLELDRRVTGGRVIYGNRTVGDFRIGEGRVGAKGKKEVRVGMKVSSKRMGKGYNGNFNNGEIYSGRLKMNLVVKVRGELLLAEVIKKTKTAELNCTFTLDFQNRKIQDLVCL